MKNKYLLLSAVLIIGGFFVYFGANTDLFKGQVAPPTTPPVTAPDETPSSTSFVHPIDNIKDIINSHITDEESGYVIKSAMPQVERQLASLFNLEGFEQIMVKEQDGDFIPCTSEEVSEKIKNKTDNGCIGFKDIGINKRLMQGLLGLVPYEGVTPTKASSLRLVQRKGSIEEKVPKVQIYFKFLNDNPSLSLSTNLNINLLNIKFLADIDPNKFKCESGQCTLPLNKNDVKELCKKDEYTYSSTQLGEIKMLSGDGNLSLSESDVCN